MSNASQNKTPSRRKATVIHTAGNSGVRALAIVRNLVLIPLYLHYIGAETYGYWLASGGLLAALGFVEFGIAGLVKQRCAQAFGQKDYEKGCLYFFHGILAYIGICVIVALACFGVSRFLGTIFSIPSGTAAVVQNAFLLAGASLALDLMMNVFIAFVTALQRPAVPAFARFGGELLNFGVSFGALFAELGLYAIPLGLVINKLVGFTAIGLTAYSLLHRYRGKLAVVPHILKDFLRTSALLVGAKLGGRVSGRIEPTLITLFLQPQLATAYMITKKAGGVFRGLLLSARGGVGASYAHVFGEGNQEKIMYVYRFGFSFFFWGSVVGLGMYTALNSSFIPLWTQDSDQFLGQGIAVLIALALFVLTMFGFLRQLLVSSGLVGQGALFIMGENFFRLGLMALFLPLLGVKGLPLAMIVSSFVLSLLLVWTIKKKVVHFRLFSFRYVPGLFWLCATSVAGYYIQISSWPLLVGYATLIGLGGSILALLMSPELRAEIPRMLNTFGLGEKWSRLMRRAGLSRTSS